MDMSARRAGEPAAALSLLALEAQPCGCVTSVYQAGPPLFEVELVEAKGPHCVFWGHRPGRIARFEEPEWPLDATESRV